MFLRLSFIRMRKAIAVLGLCFFTRILAQTSTPEVDFSGHADIHKHVKHATARHKKPPKERLELNHFPQKIRIKHEKTPEKEKPLFVLKGIKLVGSKTFNEQQLVSTYQYFLERPVSFKDLKIIQKNILEYYRIRQYFFVKVLLLEQKIENGILRLCVIESAFHSLHLEGNPGNTQRFFKHYEQTLKNPPSFNYKSIQKIVYLASKLPGVKAQAVVSPSKAVPNGADLNMFVSKNKTESFLHLNTRAGKLLGPSQVILGHTFLNPFRGGDKLEFIYGFNPHNPHLMRYASTSYKQTFYEGASLEVNANISRTHPAGAFTALGFEGRSSGVTLLATRPLLSSFRTSLNVFAQMDLAHVATFVASLDAMDVNNKTRIVRAGAHLEANDRYGQHILDLKISQGLNIFGAFKQVSQTTKALKPGSLVFTTLDIEYTRLQYLSSRVSLLGGTKIQLTGQPLLASEKHFYGGHTYGRGYDNSEITGDAGVAAYLEFRFDAMPKIRYLNRIQYYGFYDIGYLTNRGIPDLAKLSAASAGFGVRFYANKVRERLNGYFTAEMSFPLTRNVTTEGNRSPHLVFLLTCFL